jgi:beta-N-acetylhexosaminidase
MSLTPLDINQLTLEQKVGQMLLARWYRDEDDRAAVLEMIGNRSLGGIHIPARTDPAFRREVLEAADYPILIADNMESGYEGSGRLRFPCPMAIGATDREEYAYQFGRLSAIEARSDGCNVAFGPIVDIAMNPLSSCVGPRAFAGTPEHVARMATAAIRGYQDQGMIVTAKHYPGFGASPVDSHIGMVYLTADREQLIARELVAYIDAIRNADLSGVMSAHVMVPAIDPDLPASLSPTLIGLLREVGMNGLIMTDSLAMIGLTNWFGLRRSHLLAMAAGNDMVMTSYRLPVTEGYGYMLEAVRNGEVTEDLVEAAAARVIAAQNRTLRGPDAAVTDTDIALTARMREDAVTAVLTGVDSPALDTAHRHLFIVQLPNHFTNPETGKAESDHGIGQELPERVREHFPSADVFRINDYPSRDQMEHACVTTMAYDSVVMLVTSHTQAYAGSSDLTRRVLALMAGLEDKLSAVVLFGNPHAGRELPSCPRVIYGYEGCQDEALRVLAGKLPAKGALPI